MTDPPKKPPSTNQVDSVRTKTGLSNKIIKEIYSTWHDIYEDAGNFGMKTVWGGRKAKLEAVKGSMHNVLSLWITYEKTLNSAYGDLNRRWSDLTEEFRNESVNFIRSILVPNTDHGWDGKHLSDVIVHLPSKKEDWKNHLENFNSINEGTEMIRQHVEAGFKNADLKDRKQIAPIDDTRVHNDPRDINLDYPKEEMLDVRIDRLRDDLLIPEKTIKEIIVHLSSGRHVLLAGPIGTGKSALAKRLGMFWAEAEPHDDSAGGYDCREFSANNDWNTQDVIGGIVPVLKSDGQEEDNGSVGYRYHEGCFLKTLKENLGFDEMPSGSNLKIWITSNKEGHLGTWLVIDELNRADIDKAFGPLLSALENKTLSVPDHPDEMYEDIPIPGDFRIIATLNTSDRHYLYKLSDALKRRFAYVEIKSPEDDLREEEIASAYNSARLASGLAKATDKRIIFSDIVGTKLQDNLLNAYKFLVSIRSVKDLGTAVLKSTYQTILTGMISGRLDENSALDAALTSNLIPQMDSLSEESLEMLSILYFEDEPIKSLNGIRGDTTKQQLFQKESNMLMRSMYVWNFNEKGARKELYTAGRSGSVFENKVVDDETWNRLTEEFEKLHKNEIWTLPNFQAALKDLKSQASM